MNLHARHCRWFLLRTVLRSYVLIDPRKFQHQGFGTLLMEEAERIAKEEHGSEKISVISGVGVRNYYGKLGYELDGPYMSKRI